MENLKNNFINGHLSFGFPSEGLIKSLNENVNFLNFSKYLENENLHKKFFVDYEKYIKSFAEYFNNDYDYVVLHLEICGFKIWPEDMDIEDKSQYILNQYSM